jgi:hypothetical protein
MRKNVAGLVVGLIILLAGVGIAGASVQSLVYGPSSAVKCNNEVMNPGDSCKVTTNGSSTYKSYDELKSAKKSIVAPVAGIVFGSLLLLWGGFILWGAYRARRE